MEYRDKTLALIKDLKSAEQADCIVIPIKDGEKTIARLKMLTSDFTDKDVEFLADWRRANDKWFPSQFKVTNEGTKKWVKEQVIGAEDRLLFWIQTLDGQQIGHIGLYRFDFDNKTCEIDNVMRGVDNVIPGIMTFALKTLLDWSFLTLDIKGATLRVFADNKKAVALYERCGFKEKRKIPLKKIMKDGMAQWVEVEDADPGENAERYYSEMYFKK